MIEKVCSRCGIKKSIDQFFAAPQCRNGVRGECKKCRNEKGRIKLAKLRLIRAEYPVDVGMKCCSRCGQAKLLDQFYDRKDSKDRKRSDCIECTKKHRFIPSAEQVAKWQAAEKERNKIVPRKTLAGARRQAALRDAVHVTTDELVDLWRSQDGRCAVTGIKMEWGTQVTTPYSMSIDKIDPAREYTNDNIRLVCYQVNVFKNRWNDEQMYEMAVAVVENMKKSKLRLVS